MRAVIASVVMLAGCDSVFGLHVGSDDTDRDHDPGELPDAAASCTIGGSVTVGATDDTFLETPTDLQGGRPILVLDSTRTVIVKFPIVDAAELSSATLRLAHPAMARGCATGGAACEPCPAGSSGTITVTWLRPDWNESATSTERDDNGHTWAAEYASGAGDRGATVATASYSAGSRFEIALPRTASDQRAEWVAPQQGVALRMTTTDAIGIFTARDADDSCGAIELPTLTYGCAD